MQLSLAFMSYTTFVVHDQRRFSGGPKRPITAYSTEHHSTASSSSITTVTELEQQQDRAEDIGLTQYVTASQPEVNDTAAHEFSASGVIKVHSIDADGSVDSADASNAGATGHKSEGVGTVPTEDCVGEAPISKARKYPIRYPLNTDEYPLSEGVYSNCKVCCSVSVV